MFGKNFQIKFGIKTILIHNTVQTLEIYIYSNRDNDHSGKKKSWKKKSQF